VVPDNVQAQEALDKGTDSEIETTVSAEAPATSELRENDSFAKAALLAEYAVLKNEQTQRITVRDTVLYMTILVNTAIAAIYQLQRNPDPHILLIIPFASTLLFWIYAVNDFSIKQIRRYIAANVVPKLSDGSEIEAGSLFGWESSRRRSAFVRVLSRIVRLFAVWATFLGASLVVLIATQPNLRDLPQDLPWLVAAAFSTLTYVFGLWLLDL
jgi:hypothetical protein